MDFPTLADVNNASKVRLAYWHRFYIATTPEQRRILDRVSERLESLGGMTPELSDEIGFGGVEPLQKKTRPRAERVSKSKAHRAG